MSFRGLLLEKDDDGVRHSITDIDESRLPEFDVELAVEYSTVNYKDGMAVMGRPGVVRGYPMVPGVDVVGTVSDGDGKWNTGDRVVLNGWDVGEATWGGFAEKARAESGWLTPLPDAITSLQAAAIGTAGYTAMLCVLGLEEHGVTPESGPVVVTGAAGGVGSVAVALLGKLGYHVVASTGRAEEEGDYLRDLGAAEIIHRDELGTGGRPFDKPQFAGAVDAVGSTTLANVISKMQPESCVTACGLTQGPDLPGSVLPFILRGVTLRGINCVHQPQDRRTYAWDRLAADLDMAKLEAMTTVVPLDGVPAIAADILDGKVRGRVVVDVTA